MRRIQTLTVLVVVAVALAGCSALGPGESTPTDSGPSVTTGDSETLSITAADQRLREAGSFTTDWSYTVTDVDGTTTSVSDTYRVDLTTNRSYEQFSASSPSGESDIDTYTADGSSYSRVETAAGVRYQVSDQSTDVLSASTGRASSFYGDLEADARLVGTESFDGTTVSRYEYDDADAWASYSSGLSSAAFSSSENVTITDFEIAVLVDGDGVARLTTFTVSGETDDGTEISAEWRYAVTDIGSTTVEEPAWLDEAQSS